MEWTRDIMGLVAVGMIAGGLWQISPPVSLIVVGCIVLLGLISGSVRRGTRNDS